MRSLVLSGGGVRGFAHAGAISILDSVYDFDEVVGCSSGSLIGVLYAAKEDYESMMDFCLKTKAWEVFDLAFNSSGLVKGERLVKRILNHAGVERFEDLKIPMKINATNLKNGEEVVFDKGRLDVALRASMAYPGVFVPMKLGKNILADGGLSDPFPVKYSTYKNIIGVNVSYGLELPDDKLKSSDVLNQALNLLQYKLVQQNMYGFGKRVKLIQPKVSHVHVFDTRKKLQCIRAGQLAAKEFTAKLK